MKKNRPRYMRSVSVKYVPATPTKPSGFYCKMSGFPSRRISYDYEGNTDDNIHAALRTYLLGFQLSVPFSKIKFYSTTVPQTNVSIFLFEMPPTISIRNPQK